MSNIENSPALEFVGNTRNSDGTGCGIIVKYTTLEGNIKESEISSSELNCKSNLKRRLLELSNDGAEIDCSSKSVENTMQTLLGERRSEECKLIIKQPLTGFNEDCPNFFIMPRRKVKNGNTSHILANNNISDTCRISSKGDIKDWQKHYLPLAKEHPQLLFVLCLAACAPLISFAGVETTIVNFYGGKSIGKTTTNKVAASFYGNADSASRNRYYRPLNATASGIALLANCHNHMLLCMDDLANMSSNPDDTAKTLKHMGYFLSSGESKIASKNSGVDLRESLSFSLMMLSSGEESISGDGNMPSQKNLRVAKNEIKGYKSRVLDVPFEAEQLRRDLSALKALSPATCKKIADASGKYYGTAFLLFVEKLEAYLATKGAKKLRSRIDKLMTSYKEKASVKIGINLGNGFQQKQCNTFALVYAAGCIAKSEGVFDGLTSRKILKAVMSCHAALIDQTTKEYADSKESMLEFIDILSGDNTVLLDINSPPTIKSVRQKIWVYAKKGESDCYYFSDEILNVLFPENKEYMLQLLKKNNLLRKGNDGNNPLFPKVRTGSRPRTYCISKEVLRQYKS